MSDSGRGRNGGGNGPRARWRRGAGAARGERGLREQRGRLGGAGGAAVPPQRAPRGAILARSCAFRNARRRSRAGPRARTHLRTGGGAGRTWTGRGCQGTGRPRGSARSLTPLRDSGSAAAPPETSRPQPISARLLTSMRLALARAVALATLKVRAPGCLLPLPLSGRRLSSWSGSRAQHLSILSCGECPARSSLPSFSSIPANLFSVSLLFLTCLFLTRCRAPLDCSVDQRFGLSLSSTQALSSASLHASAFSPSLQPLLRPTWGVSVTGSGRVRDPSGSAIAEPKRMLGCS
ncbi:uncharacterized protein LOC132655070 [Meriones unguiculatus]|uniref:uncharacterized protein LOC132655070 n=1 Tax=Meriones unguiculatus TaxID=10047 RepID=UPI00293E8F35|nr:uncharacterized protein LOC132655070 [Meriones unguiculatus]